MTLSDDLESLESARSDAVRTSRPAPGSDLEHAVQSLPEGARMVFVLHDIEGYQHEEIGRLMGIAEGTSKAQLHRARRLLREALTQ